MAMAKRYETTRLSVCTICLLLFANGEYDDGTDIAAEKYTAWDALWSDDLAYIVPGSEELGFCKSECDACGETDHGDRHEAFLMIPLDSLEETNCE